MDELGLFAEPEPIVPPPAEKLTPGARRRRRHLTLIAQGRHPLGGHLHTAARRDGDRDTPGTPRCGTCALRVTLLHHNRSYPKCALGAYEDSRTWPDGRTYTWTEYPRAKNSEASDVAAWWPACTGWEEATDG